MPRLHGYRTSTRRYLSTTQTRLPQACRWVSITVHYPPLQKRRVSRNSRRFRDKNLPERIPLHPLTVNFDSPLLLRSSFHLLFFIPSHDPSIVFWFPSSPDSIVIISGPGVAEGGCVLVISDNIWSAMPLGLVCDAARRMTPQGP